MEYECVQGDPDIEIGKLIYDSRKLEKDALFVCISGTAVNGHQFAQEAAEKGAAALVVSEEVQVPEHIAVIKVKDTRYALALVSPADFYYPAEQLKVIGITGTKGKTTTTYMVKSILEKAGYKTCLIGTIETIIGDQTIPSANTTPESYLIQQYFRKMADASCDCCVMEVSSQGLMLHRTQGFVFDYGIFTNIEPDHIGPNEHKDFEDYLACKGLLFRQCLVGIVNKDDEHWEKVTAGDTCRIETYGIKQDADLRAEDLQLISGGGKLGVSFRVKGLMNFQAQLSMPGRFSVYNALTAIAICRHFGVSEEAVEKALPGAKVKGRIEFVKVSDDFTLMIDMHTMRWRFKACFPR